MRLRNAGAALTLWPGCEITIDEKALAEILGESFTTLGGVSDRFLIEIGEHCTLDYAAAAVEELSARSFVPVIAHPERNLFWPECPDACEMLAEFGAEIQINACSLTGQQGGDFTRRSAWELVKRGLVDYVASDAHSLTDGRLDAFLGIGKSLESAVGGAAARRLLWDNPARLLGLDPA